MLVVNAVRKIKRDAMKLAKEKNELHQEEIEDIESDSGLRLSKGEALAFAEETTRVKKNILEQQRKAKAKISSGEDLRKAMQEERNEEKDEDPMWTAKESLSYKIHNMLSDRQYQTQRTSFGTLVPLEEIKRLFSELTAHVILSEITTGGPNPVVVGFKTTLHDILQDAIRTQSMGIASQGVNELKITGDGGKLCPRHPMTCIFLQSLMMPQDQQGLRSAAPVSIMTATEDYGMICKGTEGLNDQIEDLEKNGLKVDGVRYKFRFYFCADLKFMWLVSSLSLFLTHELSPTNSHYVILVVESRHEDLWGSQMPLLPSALWTRRQHDL